MIKIPRKKTIKKRNNSLKVDSEKFFLNRRFVYIALAILLIVLIAINIDKFTGEAIKLTNQRITKIYVSSDPNIAKQDNPVVRAGEKIYITIETGSEGTKRRLNIYDSNDFTELRKSTVEIQENCGGSTCRPNRIASGNIKTYPDWQGKYCAKVLDFLTNKEVEACFTVR